VLRAWLRQRLGRDQEHRAGSIDSQAVKTSGVDAPRGFDSAKKGKGRKRHLLVDTAGFLLRAVVHPANSMDHNGVKRVLHESIPPR
jgi:putative transposase